jgi:hypothetical protein
LRSFLVFNMSSLQKFNGSFIDAEERSSAHHKFSPLFREVSDTKFSGEVPSSPIPPKRTRKGSTITSSSSTSFLLPPQEMTPTLTSSSSTNHGTIKRSESDPTSSATSSQHNNNVNNNTVVVVPSTVVWKPYRASSKLMTFELVKYKKKKNLHIHRVHNISIHCTVTPFIF